jgi:predicted Zn-dependent protease
MREIRATCSFDDDAEATDYINNLELVASRSPDARQEFDFFLIRDSQINAFALPGGFSGNTGLILRHRVNPSWRAWR